MKISSFELTAKNADSLKTEIMFSIASAKALAHDLVRLDISEGSSESRISAITRILRAAKKNGQIQLYIRSCDLDDGTTESKYLKNKFPELYQVGEDGEFFILKI